MAAPHVTGAVALLASLRPEASPATLRALIRRSARDLGHPGHDPIFGAGALDLVALLDAALLEIDFAIEGPESGTIHNPSGGSLRYAVEAFGQDVGGVAVAVARGLTGRTFVDAEDLEHWTLTRSTSSEAEIATLEWDISEEEDGPFVIRFRILAPDGPPIEEYRIVSVERIVPFELADGIHKVGAPAIDGSRVVWPMEATAEADEANKETGLAMSRFSARAARKSDSESNAFSEVAVTGIPRDVAVDRNVVAWRFLGEEGFQLAWCRLPKARRKTVASASPAMSSNPCLERAIERPPGVVSGPWVGGGWLIWQRVDAVNRSIEGCYVGRKGRDCVPRSLVDLEAGPRWTLRSFDGKTMLLQAGAELAFCAPTTKADSCTPRLIHRSLRTPVITEPVHDGRLLVFADVTIGFTQLPGCLPSEGPPECPRTVALLQSYHVCEVSLPGRVCDSIAISQPAPTEDLGGLAVEGRRIAWSVAGPVEAPSVYFCEFDSGTRRCAPQRVTGAPGIQDAPSLSVNSLVWRGGRSGAQSIWAYALPDLVGPAQIDVARGQNFSISLTARRGGSRTLSYEIELLDDGVDEAAFRLEIKDGGRPGGRIWLRGFIPEDASAAGDVFPLRVSAQDGAGLFSEWTGILSLRPRSIRLAPPTRRFAPRNSRLVQRSPGLAPRDLGLAPRDEGLAPRDEGRLCFFPRRDDDVVVGGAVAGGVGEARIAQESKRLTAAASEINFAFWAGSARGGHPVRAAIGLHARRLCPAGFN